MTLDSNAAAVGRRRAEGAAARASTGMGARPSVSDTAFAEGVEEGARSIIVPPAADE